MTTEPLNPSVNLTAYNRRFAENEWGILAAICLCIEAAGGTVTSYPPNTAGIITALRDLANAILTIAGGASILNYAITLGEDVAFGEALYIAADGKAYKATASGSRDQATVQGLAVENGSSGDVIQLALAGGLIGYGGLTPGAEYFLSASTPGGITVTPPSGAGHYVTKAGEALSASVLMVKPGPAVELV